jgi:microcystin-dependent protein
MDAFTGTIMMWPLNWAPDGWNMCDGTTLQIQQYAALYSLIGIAYGGDGVKTFQLPDMRGRVPVGYGFNPAINTAPYTLGKVGGTEAVALTMNEMPAHNHAGGSGSGTFSATLPALTGTGSLGVSAAANSGVTNTPSATDVPAVIPPVQINPTTTRPVNAYGTADGNTSWPVAVSIPAGTGMTGSVSGIQLPVNGAGQAHPNLQPYNTLNFIICLNGYYPPRP